VKAHAGQPCVPHKVVDWYGNDLLTERYPQEATSLPLHCTHLQVKDGTQMNSDLIKYYESRVLIEILNL